MTDYQIVRTSADNTSYLEMVSHPNPDENVVTIDNVSITELIELLDDDAIEGCAEDFAGWATFITDIVIDQYPWANNALDMARRILWTIACAGGFTDDIEDEEV